MSDNENPNDELEIVETDESNTETEETQNTEEFESEDSEQEKTDSKKSEWVELSPEAQRKFNDMYKQTKMSDQRNKFLLDANQKALQRIAELEARFNQTDEAEAERILQNSLQAALDDGDTAKATKIMTELADFKAEAKLKSLRKTEIPKQQMDLPGDDVEIIRATVFEKGDDGNYKRPWLHEGNPRYGDMLKHATIISAQVQHEFGYLDASEVMQRLDEVMTKKTTTKPPANNRQPDVLGGGLTNKNNRGTLKISPQEMEMARKLGIDPKLYVQSRDSEKRR